MITILLTLWLSAAAGYLLRRHPVRCIERITGWTVWLLLFLMGEEVGGNPEVLQGMGRIGADALVLTACTAMACTSLSGLCWKMLRRKRSCATGPEANGYAGDAVPLLTQMRDSMVIVGFFFLGCIAGYNGWCGFLPEEAGFCALCFLLACVGFGIGQNREIRAHILDFRALEPCFCDHLHRRPICSVKHQHAARKSVCHLLYQRLDLLGQEVIEHAGGKEYRTV